MKIKNINSYYIPKKLKLTTTSFNNKQLKIIFEKTDFIRKVELKLALEKKNGIIKGPVHLAVGQEAVSVGVSLLLNKEDTVFGNHRSHGHILSLGTNLKKFFSEILARKTGLSGGMGGSMHLIDKSVGFGGSVPIVGATVPISLGSALIKKAKKKKNIAVSYFGDSAIEEGAVLESLNLASIWKLPIMFVVENNLYASHMHISQRQPSKNLIRYAKANHLNYAIANGNDIFDVFKKAKKLIKDCRSKNQPAFLEVVTYRHLGHVDWREDIDVGLTRSIKEINSWKKQDPLLIIKKYMIDKKNIQKEELENIEKINIKYIDHCWQYSLNQPFPEKNKITKYLYD